MKANIKIKVGHLLLLPLAVFSCNSSDNKLSGGWVVDKAYYNNKAVTWNLLTNSIKLYNNHTCLLPIPYEKSEVKNYDQGKWTAYEQNDTLFLQIKTINIIFNRTLKFLIIGQSETALALVCLLKLTYRQIR
ncbi:hypothetical protein DYU05_07860 [Mucilaginibacter terrenus]|uniref:Lipocalin-like domain-containing protein n=1 Tax=Mucilaginibacter terrenus TaxID=2482727 RepID=A0A3E2NWY2_9SPHI|nr:hypothetical protein [Mucilaginibacter terrenus]RFZ85502.1 hypothetical protein DYU05_07860 [Mucilaginibacter terrenus]